MRELKGRSYHKKRMEVDCVQQGRSAQPPGIHKVLQEKHHWCLLRVDAEVGVEKLVN